MTADTDMADWSKLCRGCLGKTQLVDIFDGSDIRTKFYENTTIMVSEGDGLPAYLCLDCLDTLNFAHQFKKECLRIDSELKARLMSVKKKELKQEHLKKKIKTEKNSVETFIKLEDLSDEQKGDDDYVYVVVIKEGADGEKTMEAQRVGSGNSKQILDPENIIANIKTECEQDDEEYDDDPNAFLLDYPVMDDVKTAPLDPESSLNAHFESEIDIAEHAGATHNEMEVENGEVTHQDKLNLIQVLSEDGGIVDGNIIEYEGETVALVSDVLSAEMSIEEDSVAYTQEEVVVSNGDENFEMLNDGTVVIEYDGDDEPITVIQQEDGSFLCDCGESFVEFSDYEQHKWTHNDFACPICGKGFESKEIVAGHILLHNQPDAQLPCPFCSQLVKRNMLTTHIKINHNQCRPTCGVCNKSFASDNNLKRHMLIHGVRHYECDICHKRFNQKNVMQTHRLTHTSPGPNVCNVCQKDFITHESLITHHNEGCDGDGDGEDEDGDMNAKRHICNTCGKEYATIGSLRSHIEYIHNSQQIELLCSECGEVLPTRKAMYAHSYTHRQSRMKHLRRFSCGICGKGCASHAMLLMHERVHTNERPFKCSKCTLAFKTKTHLTTHQLTHTQEKRFGCSVCMKFFALKGNLVVHLRTHTGERPYVCSICNQAFIDSKYLKKHKLRRHDIGNIPWNQYY